MRFVTYDRDFVEEWNQWLSEERYLTMSKKHDLAEEKLLRVISFMAYEELFKKKQENFEIPGNSMSQENFEIPGNSMYQKNLEAARELEESAWFTISMN